MLLLFVCSYTESFLTPETETCLGGTDLIEYTLIQEKKCPTYLHFFPSDN